MASGCNPLGTGQSPAAVRGLDLGRPMSGHGNNSPTAMSKTLNFDDAFRSRLRDLFVWRRDVRRFRQDPLPDGALERLIEIACLAPSVGLSQPWRFVVVDDPGHRTRIQQNFEICNSTALAAQTPERAALYVQLKLAGLREAPGHLAVFADHSTPKGHGLGRHTMPEMIDYSVVTAVHTMWLAARSEGIGMGWVSILDPQAVAVILDVPLNWRFIGYFCLGFPDFEHNIPELEQAGWERRCSASSFIVRR